MIYGPSDSPAARLDHYIPGVEERPRRQVRPGRWWHFLPVTLALVGTATFWVWGMGWTFGAW